MIKGQVTEKEALKFIKHSEYSVVEQLNKLPAWISLLTILLNSEPHRKALIRVLNETYVAHNIWMEKIDQLVSNIAVSNVITFTDEEIPLGRRGNTKALYITISCKGYTLLRALIDNESSMTVIPMATLTRMPVDISHMRKTHLVVCAFAGTRKKVLGNIELPIQIGPCIFNIDFQVMDINPSYNCMLGQPWIHMVGAVPSTFHQKVKFMVEEQLISMEAKNDIVATLITFNPYIEVDKNVVKCSFQSLEVVNTTFVEKCQKILTPRLLKVSKIGIKQIIGKRVQAGLGLGNFFARNKQGCVGGHEVRPLWIGLQTIWERRKEINEKPKR